MTTRNDTHHLLHLDSSGNDRSLSRELTARFVDRWRSAHPGGRVTTRDLVKDPIPHLGSAATAALEAVGQGTTGDAAAEWSRFEQLLGELEAATTVLIGAPMHNFGVPSALKAWIDHVAGVPGRTFNPGDGGLLRGKRAVFVLTRGGGYGPGTPRAPFDFQVPYLRSVFAELIGIDDVHFITAELRAATRFPALAHLAPVAETSLNAALIEIDRTSVM